VMPVGERALRPVGGQVVSQPHALRRGFGRRQIAVQRDDVPRPRS
jgi:hypothetical protein